MPLPGPRPQSSADLDYYAQVFDKRYPGRGLGAAYRGYAASHPGLSAYQAAQEFLLILDTRGLDFALAEGAAAVGTATGQATKGIGAGLVDTFHGLALGSWLLRIGEILTGLVLLGIGLNAMLGGKPLKVVTGAAGLASKVVP